MGTFLTTSKMHPALAARIEASVRGRRRRAPGASLAPGLVSAARLAVVAIVVAGILAVVLGQRRDRRALETARAGLLEAVRRQSASLTPADQGFVARVESLLVRSAGPYEGDLVADELRSPAGFAAVLARPSVYVRGPLPAFATAAGIAEAAAGSTRDPLLLCLLDPPPSRAEKVLLGKVRAAYGAVPEPGAARVGRLHDAQLGLPFLLPAWEDRVRGAEDADTLARLARDLERAPVERARRVVRASQLVFAMDEPGTGGGPTELDGERAHDVRIGIVEMPSERILLRARKRVDPSWISLARRPEYAGALDGCALALDLREGLHGAPGGTVHHGAP